MITHPAVNATDSDVAWQVVGGGSTGDRGGLGGLTGAGGERGGRQRGAPRA
jgi:hypothetical protein